MFPGDRPGEHLAALWHVWHFVRNTAGKLGSRTRALYDLRHTFASVGAGGGLSLADHWTLAWSHAAAHHAEICASCRRSAPRSGGEDHDCHNRGREARRSRRCAASVHEEARTCDCLAPRASDDETAESIVGELSLDPSIERSGAENEVKRCIESLRAFRRSYAQRLAIKHVSPPISRRRSKKF